MALVLGIDAAWSAKNPSGMPLVATGPDKPRLIRAAPSYEHFMEGAPPENWNVRINSLSSLPELLAEAKSIGGEEVNVITVDMPVAREPVRARRCCDIAISKSFGGMGCSTHSPTAERPGTISDMFFNDAVNAGFSLRTASSGGNGNALLEVYPHVALLALCNSQYRLPYKLSRRRAYWPNRTPEEGREQIRREWNRILDSLRSKISVLDAIVCCWVGLEWLSGRAKPYGNAEAAIWVPVC
jgi:predicted RNase H-like nuclease